MSWKDLFTFNKRDFMGLACWLALSLVLGFLCLPVMVAREVYQYKCFHLPRFEWEDVIRYGIVITIGGVGNIFIVKWIVSLFTT